MQLGNTKNAVMHNASDFVKLFLLQQDSRFWMEAHHCKLLSVSEASREWDEDDPLPLGT